MSEQKCRMIILVSCVNRKNSSIIPSICVMARFTVRLPERTWDEMEDSFYFSDFPNVGRGIEETLPIVVRLLRDIIPLRMNCTKEEFRYASNQYISSVGDKIEALVRTIPRLGR